MSGGVLGCGSYDAYVLPRGGGRTPVATIPWTSIDWTRVLDDTSSASAVTDKTICTAFNGIKPWRHELALFRDGDEMWVGPIIDPSAPVMTDRWQFMVDARDVSAWWDHRLIHEDHEYVVATDLATIFQDFATDAMLPDNSPGVHVVTTPCGVTGVMTVLASQHQMAGSQLRDLANTGIDWTVVRRDILAGGATVPTATLGPFRDEHFLAPPLVTDDGSSQANRWVVRGSGGGAQGDAIYADSVNTDAASLDGLLESIDTVQSIQDYISAKAAADSRTLLTSSVTSIQNAILAPTAPFAVSELVPGALCHVELHEGPIPVSGQFRLQSVTGAVRSDSGSVNEQITLVFQPVGTR